METKTDHQDSDPKEPVHHNQGVSEQNEDVLWACREYMDGTLVGSLVHGKVPDSSVAKKGGSSSFGKGVGEMLDDLIDAFTRCGALDCEKFRAGL